MTQPDSKTQLSATGFEAGGGSGHSRCSRFPGDRDYNLTSSAPGASSSGSLAGALIRFPDEFDLLFPPHQSSFFGYSERRVVIRLAARSIRQENYEIVLPAADLAGIR